MSAQKLHEALCHSEKRITLNTENKLGIKIQGTFGDCESCDEAKAKQKKLPKVTESTSKIRGERLHIDISSVKYKSYGGGKHWLLVVDDATDVNWSYIQKKKSELTENMIQLILDLKNKNNITTKFIRCDNAGENKKLEEE